MKQHDTAKQPFNQDTDGQIKSTSIPDEEKSLFFIPWKRKKHKNVHEKEVVKGAHDRPSFKTKIMEATGMCVFFVIVVEVSFAHIFPA